MSKEDNFKEKFKLALLSTANAIADDYSPDNDKKNKKKSKIDLFELDKLELSRKNLLSIVNRRIKQLEQIDDNSTYCFPEKQLSMF